MRLGMYMYVCIFFRPRTLYACMGVYVSILVRPRTLLCMRVWVCIYLFWLGRELCFVCVYGCVNIYFG